jgi:hypothetical protein
MSTNMQFITVTKKKTTPESAMRTTRRGQRSW